MESFSLNSAKSFIGKNVNLHLKDGSVIVNVYLSRIKKNEYGKGSFIEYSPTQNKKIDSISIRNVAYAELINQNFMRAAC
ncbi:MAG: hypothetical protein GX638_17100 [Crenarchaeota archaeon]|nr:hypothetical protein [Thermoproteota archaeon]